METNLKKTAVDLTDLAIGILVLGIAVSIGANILIATRDARLTSLPTYNTFNETISGTDAGTALTNSWINTIGTITNVTSGVTVPSTNYTSSIDSFGTGTITMDGGCCYNGSNVNVTYNTYNTSQPDWNLPNEAAIGLAEYGSWFKIIVIVGVASLVLALIFMAFGRKGQGSSGTY